jgi:Flp pilus assembly protein TadD
VHAADLLENYGTPAAVIKVLEPYKGDRDPEIASRLGLAYLRNGQTADAEDQLRLVVEGAAGSTPAAAARANYGLAEVTLQTLEQFQPYEGLEAMEEAIGLIDVTVQAFMTAARQSDLRYSQAALARLGAATIAGEKALKGLQLPPDLDDASRAQVNEAIEARITGMKDGTTEALAACAKRAQESYQVDASGAACLAGKVPSEIPLEPQPLQDRTASGDLPGVEALRDTLLKNPNDLEALRGLGRALLTAHDPHAARLVLQRAVESGGDYSDLNLLGVACYEAGDKMGAMTAFGKARESGSTGAAANLATLYREVGATALAKEVAPTGTPTGALISGAGGTQ